MTRSLAGVAVFTVVLVLFFVGIGEVITRVSGEGARRPPDGTALGAGTPEVGEGIFWGKGKCSTCHAVGSRGSAIRGPNQGDSGPLGLPIGARAEARARERAEATGRPHTATDYLVESLTDPGAYVVKGYKNEMPDPSRPPIRLGSDELQAVITYLQSLGGTPDPAAIRLPPRVLGGTRAPTAEEWRPYLVGDARKGEALFFDPESSAGCAKCHQVHDRGGTVGPELTQVAGTRDPTFIVESILEPSKVIASGYEPILIITKDNRYLTGVIRQEDGQSIEIADTQGDIQKVLKQEIQQRAPQTTSLMPGNFREILTVEEFHDLLAFVLTLR